MERESPSKATKDDIIFEPGCMVTERDGTIRQLREENSDLKRLLRLAVEDLNTIDRICVKHCFQCPCDFTKVANCKWKHADEAEKLIGGEENG